MFRSLRSISIALLYCLAMGVRAQSPAEPVPLRPMVLGGDTVATFQLSEVLVEGRWNASDRREAARYDRLTRIVVKVYPYARITGELLREYEHDLETIRNHGDQDLYVKLAEAELRAEFEAEVKNLTASQGRVLVKLIDRQTGRTSYDLVKELRGNFTAFVWQGFARLFGQDLRSKYDPDGNDRMMELIVQRIERGELAIAERPAHTAKAQARLEKRKARLYKRYGLTPATSMLDLIEGGTP